MVVLFWISNDIVFGARWRRRCVAKLWKTAKQAARRNSLLNRPTRVGHWIFYIINAQENLEDRKNVPQRLKPGMAMSFTARVNPCPSRTDFSHTL
jgi:hypothetical protein